MPWAKFDDRYPWHRKVRPLSDAAFRLDVSAICWCAENLTDGVIEPEHLALVSDVRRPAKAAAELVKWGRWHDDAHDCGTCPPLAPGAYVIHDYLDFNPTREKVEEDREKRRKAGELGGKASGQSRSREAKAKQSASQVLNDLPSKDEAPVASSATNPRTRTRSSTTSKTSGGNVKEVDARDPNEPPRCSQHKGMRREDAPACWACGHKREQWEASLVTDAVFDRGPWCGDDGCNPMTRQRETPFGVIRCPECHPLADEAS